MIENWVVTGLIAESMVWQSQQKEAPRKIAPTKDFSLTQRTFINCYELSESFTCLTPNNNEDEA